MTITVRPAPGRRVRLPDGTLVPAEGAEVERDSFIERRLLDGDLVLAPAEPAPAADAADAPPPPGAGARGRKEPR